MVGGGGLVGNTVWPFRSLRQTKEKIIKMDMMESGWQWNVRTAFKRALLTDYLTIQGKQFLSKFSVAQASQWEQCTIHMYIWHSSGTSGVDEAALSKLGLTYFNQV